jgi:hypothetical protein
MKLLDNGSGDYAPIYGYESAEEFMEAGEYVEEYTYLGMTFRTWDKGPKRQYKWIGNGNEIEGIALAKWIVMLHNTGVEGWENLATWLGSDPEDSETFTDCIPEEEKKALYDAALAHVKENKEWEDVGVSA